MLRQSLLVGVLLVAACGGPKIKIFEDDYPNLNEVPTTVQPPGGTYSYRPIVTITKETTAKSTGVLQVMTPSDKAYLTRFSGGAGCVEPDLDKPREERRQSACVEVRESGELKYFLSPGWIILGHQDDSEKRQVHYDVQLVNQDVTANGAKLTETETTCDLRPGLDEHDSVYFTMKFGEESVLTARMDLVETKIDRFAQFEVMPPKGSDAAAASTIYGGDMANDEAGCTFTADAWIMNGESRGTFVCSGLRGPKDALYELSGPWTCDGFQ